MEATIFAIIATTVMIATQYAFARGYFTFPGVKHRGEESALKIADTVRDIMDDHLKNQYAPVIRHHGKFIGKIIDMHNDIYETMEAMTDIEETEWDYMQAQIHEEYTDNIMVKKESFKAIMLFVEKALRQEKQIVELLEEDDKVRTKLVKHALQQVFNAAGHDKPDNMLQELIRTLEVRP